MHQQLIYFWDHCHSSHYVDRSSRKGSFRFSKPLHTVQLFETRWIMMYDEIIGCSWSTDPWSPTFLNLTIAPHSIFSHFGLIIKSAGKHICLVDLKINVYDFFHNPWDNSWDRCYSCQKWTKSFCFPDGWPYDIIQRIDGG